MHRETNGKRITCVHSDKDLRNGNGNLYEAYYDYFDCQTIRYILPVEKGHSNLFHPDERLYVIYFILKKNITSIFIIMIIMCVRYGQ